MLEVLQRAPLEAVVPFEPDPGSVPLSARLGVIDTLPLSPAVV